VSLRGALSATKQSVTWGLLRFARNDMGAVVELKDYQKTTLKQIKRYLDSLAEFRDTKDKVLAMVPNVFFDVPAQAWGKVVGTPYHSVRNGLGEDLPNFF
jgi:hypothetical protein